MDDDRLDAATKWSLSWFVMVDVNGSTPGLEIKTNFTERIIQNDSLLVRRKIFLKAPKKF